MLSALRSFGGVSRYQTSLAAKRIILANFAKYTRNMSKSALIILAPGAEEMEFVISADVLRRAGVAVTVAGLKGSAPVKCSRDVVITPDATLEDAKAKTFDVVILPGGLGGSKAMAESPLVGEILKKQEGEGRLIAAICAAPTALASHSIFPGKSLTSYPSVKGELESAYKYIDDQKVVQDGNLITSRGPGTAFDFALKIAEVLAGDGKATEVAKGMMLKSREADEVTDWYVVAPSRLSDVVKKLCKKFDGEMPKTALVILAPGAEEMEFVISTDVLRRAGVAVTVAGINDCSPVKCSRDVVIIPEVKLEDVIESHFDAVVLPGGLHGSKVLAESSLVGEVLKKQAANGGIVGGICAAPTAFASNNLFIGKRLTSYPSSKEKLDTLYEYVDDVKVVQDGNLITSRGPATAFDFALKIAEALVGEEELAAATKRMLF